MWENLHVYSTSCRQFIFLTYIMHYESCGLILFQTFSPILHSVSSSGSVLSLFKPSRAVDLYLFLRYTEIYEQRKEELRHQGSQWSILACPLIIIERLIQEALLPETRLLVCCLIRLCSLADFGSRRMDLALAEHCNKYGVVSNTLQHVNSEVHEKDKK